MTIPKSEQHVTRQRGWHQKSRENRTKFLRQNSKEVTPFSLSSSRSFIYFIYFLKMALTRVSQTRWWMCSVHSGHALGFRLMNEAE